MKQNLKKMLLAFMVGIGIMGTVSAYAQNDENFTIYEVTTWDQFHGVQREFKGSRDKVCQEATQSIEFIRKYYDKINGHWTHIQEATYSGKSEIWVHPSSGARFIECYVERKVTFIYPNETYVDIIPDWVESLQILVKEKYLSDPCEGENAPEWCKLPPKDPCFPYSVTNPKACPDTPPAAMVGGVACDGSQRTPCVWVDYEKTVRNPQARAALSQCALVHENFHVNDNGPYGTCATRGPYKGMLIYTDLPNAKANAEWGAYLAGYYCLKEAEDKCCSDECKKEISDIAEAHLKEATYYYSNKD